jgi:hypothetical protein
MNEMQKDRLLRPWNPLIMPAVKTGMRDVKVYRNAFRNLMKGGRSMATRTSRGRRPIGLAASVLARPRELFGESLPELLLVTAVVAAVVSAVFALNGAG